MEIETFMFILPDEKRKSMRWKETDILKRHRAEKSESI